MKDFAEKVALVAGATSGIGTAVAARLAAGGAEVYYVDLDSPAAEVRTGAASRAHVRGWTML
jgi:NAD(P)-dependent dehydrogenase (short-subunit alcohol dehydrogenase family)